MSEQDTSKLQLAQVIKQLRSELTTAAKDGDGEDIRFTVEDIELELDITVENQKEGNVGAKFYVLTSSYKGSKKDIITQKIKLKLKPSGKDGEKVKVSDSEKIKINKG